ncbi:hypothetical protein CAB17_20415 [Legionella sainthelensi]|nr:hypothetical protein CAB17_20415 [Legionella sainthelensi]
MYRSPSPSAEGSACIGVRHLCESRGSIEYIFLYEATAKVIATIDLPLLRKVTYLSGAYQPFAESDIERCISVGGFLH